MTQGAVVYKTSKPDLQDNLLKGVCDALTGILWERDQQICRVDTVKLYGHEAMTEIWVKELTKEE